jgi:ABC-type transport system involved in multi-copper enzyme maturation permease subunit
MIQRVSAVALTTFRESVRDRLFLIVGLFGLMLLGATTLLSPLTIGAQGKIVADVGLGGMLLFGLFVVAFLGSNLLRKELDHRTVTTVLSKPLSRREYLHGKFCGLGLTLLCMLLFMAVVFLLATLLTPATFAVRYLAAFYMILLELLLLLAAALLFASFASPVLAGLFTCGLFAAGHLSEDLLGLQMLLGGSLHGQVMRILYYVVPNLEIFNVRGDVVHGLGVPAAHLVLASLYALCYGTVLLVLAGAIFARKELR